MTTADRPTQKKIRRTLSSLGKQVDPNPDERREHKATVARVTGPYHDSNINAYRLVVFDGNKRKSVSAKSIEEAVHLKAELERTLQQCERTIGSAIAEFLEDKRKQGLKERSLQTLDYKLKYFLPLDRMLGSFTAEQAQNLYEAETTKISRFGKPMRAMTHRLLLRMAKLFFRWAVERNYIHASPLEKVKPIGKPHAGKEQLRVDEGRRLTQTLVSAAEQREEGAIATLTQLMLGLRTEEVLFRQVRDLDDDGRILWIPSGKTKNARRRLEVPEVLRQYLLRLVADRPPDRLLFGGHRPHPYKQMWLWRQVKKYCALANLPRVCPHSLRGLHSSLAVAAGCTSSAVASALGHGSFEITAKHYVDADTLKNSSVHRVATALGSGPVDVLTGLLERLCALSPEDRKRLLTAVESATAV
jgi:integrase